jgi:1A family penicillin-binding protein
MTPFLIQLLAMGLVASQVFTKPDQVRTHFDPRTSTAIATTLLKDGCRMVTGQFKDARFNPEVLLEAMRTDAESATESTGTTAKIFKSIDFGGILNAYRYFCKGDKSVADKIDLAAVVEYYNKVFEKLPDVNSLRNYKFPEATTVLDGDRVHFTEMYGAGNRRIFVPISKIPDHVKQAFVAAEDQNFYQHKGVDQKGLLRAFMSVASGAGGARPQGGSTITQQVVKNFLLNDDLTLERKMREMVLATRLERALSKDQILELYLNHIFLGRSSWGVEMAARNYFGPKSSVTNLTVEQAALLAALTKGPNYYNPDRQPERASDRRQYVLSRMREEGSINADQLKALSQKPIQTVRFVSPTMKGGYYFIDSIQRELKAAAGIDLKKGSAHTVHSTLDASVQRSTEEAVREGLVRYEQSTGRRVWSGPEGSIARDVEQHQMKWQEILPRVQPRHYDVPWTVATVLDVNRPQVGLPSGQQVPLQAPAAVLRKLKTYDLIFVAVTGKQKQVANLIIPPKVQGAAVVMENQTGKVIAISGGFSYSQSEYNRALLAARQPGSTIKPFVYLTALNVGYQPNTLLPDLPHDPPLARNWIPKNYDLQNRGLVTFRSAIENSLNLPTVQLAARLGGNDPLRGLHYVQFTMKSVGLYKDGTQKKDFAEILGSKETQLINLAQAYATVANVGLKPTPHFIESVSRDGRTVYTNRKPRPVMVGEFDRVGFYQVKKLLEGTLVRGTAARLNKLAGYVAGKTGTSNDESDAWFVCFTNDITVAVWVGYDNKKIYRNLGGGSTGGRVALPIAERILKAYFDLYGKPEKLAGPPPEIKSQITEVAIDLKSGVVGAGDFPEIFRIDPKVRGPLDTRMALLRPGEHEMMIIPVLQSEEQRALPLGGAPGNQEPLILPESEPAPERDQSRQVDPIYQQLTR